MVSEYPDLILWIIHAGEHSNSLFTIVAFETLSTWMKSCKSAGSRLVKTLSIALQDNLGNDCRLLLQPVEVRLSTTLTNVLGATRTLSYLRVLL